MAELVLVKKEDIVSIADAIREKTDISKGLTINDMINEISAISTGIDTSDASAASSDIISGKTAYVNGEKITGTYIPPKTTKTIYIDWSQDQERIGMVSYISNGVLETIYTNDAEEIDAEGGIVMWQDGIDGATITDNFILLSDYSPFIAVAQKDYETITIISTGSQDM